MQVATGSPDSGPEEKQQSCFTREPRRTSTQPLIEQRAMSVAAKAGREIFVPGRICIMGEHSDWAGSYRRFNPSIVPGMCLVSGTNQGLYARVYPHPDKLVLTSVDHNGKRSGPEEIDMDPTALLAAANSGSHFAYMAGVAYQIVIRYHVQGMVIENYKTDLPLAKGLSSSAAACVLCARSFNRLYDLKMTVRGEMDLAYHGEITTPSQCGRMDQCCAFGSRPVLMTFDGDRLDCQELSLGGTLFLVIVELAGEKDTTTILQRLTKAYPVADDEQQRNLQALLGETNRELVGQAVGALTAGDMQRVGEIMVEAQRLFDAHATPMCPSQLTSPNLHRVLELEALKPHIWGAKGVGSQGDGCAQLLCRSEADMERAMQIVTAELGMSCMPLQIGSITPVEQALIPAASFSQALFPASKSLPPALFPVLDSSDGLLKPAVLVLVEEAVNAGLMHVNIIVSANHKAEFEAIFHSRPHIKDYNKMPPRLRQYSDSIAEMGKRVSLIVQEEQQGLGHAVLIAQASLKPGPFVLMLGDHLYRSSHETGASCVAQLLSAYSGTSMMALRRTRGEAISHFGCVAGKWEMRRDTPAYKRIAITSIVEKPTVEYARSNLRVPGLADDEYLTAFGLYVISEPSLFDTLRQHEAAREAGGSAGLLQLTPALDALRAESGLGGVLLDGERYDIGGDPSTYLCTLNALSKPAQPHEPAPLS